VALSLNPVVTVTSVAWISNSTFDWTFSDTPTINAGDPTTCLIDGNTPDEYTSVTGNTVRATYASTAPYAHFQPYSALASKLNLDFSFAGGGTVLANQSGTTT
jgi:hypothetical protein